MVAQTKINWNDVTIILSWRRVEVDEKKGKKNGRLVHCRYSSVGPKMIMVLKKLERPIGRGE